MTITLPPETERLARQVAARSGRTPEAVLQDALAIEAHIAGVALAETSKPVRRVDADRALAIARRIASRPLRDPRTAREILDEAWGGVDDRRR